MPTELEDVEEMGCERDAYLGEQGSYDYGSEMLEVLTHT